MEIWDWLPNELKLVLMMALPVIGKGMIFVPLGICELQFSLEKTVFLCSIGSSIKVGYYFVMIYGAERYLIRKGFLSVKKFEYWLQKARAKHQWLYECVGIMSLAIIPNVGPGVLPSACVAYISGVKFFRGIAVTIAGSSLTIYLIALGVMHNKLQIDIGWEMLKNVF